MHGKISQLQILEQARILQNIPNGIDVMRYHSLVLKPTSLAEQDIRILAQAPSLEADGQNEIMAIEHNSLPIFGVQFHPESFATDFGEVVVGNFIQECLKGSSINS